MAMVPLSKFWKLSNMFDGRTEILFLSRDNFTKLFIPCKQPLESELIWLSFNINWRNFGMWMKVPSPSVDNLLLVKLNLIKYFIPMKSPALRVSMRLSSSKRILNEGNCLDRLKGTLVRRFPVKSNLIRYSKWNWESKEVNPFPLNESSSISLSTFLATSSRRAVLLTDLQSVVNAIISHLQ